MKGHVGASQIHEGNLVLQSRSITPHEISRRKKRLAKGEELNMLVALVVTKAMKTTNKSKANDTSYSENDTEAEHFNFKHLKIGTDGNTE